MKIAIHQLHYFPWLGYFDKMLKVDKFIILDDVQLTDKSFMFRHHLLSQNGVVKYITIPFLKKDYMSKSFNQLEINTEIDWQKQHKNFILENYRKSPFFSEVWDKISFIFEKKYTYLQEVTLDTVMVLKELLDIKTEIVFQSDLHYPLDSKKNQLVLDICKASNANYYLSGNGAKKYMEMEVFDENNIEVAFQEFSQPIYQQYANLGQFVPGLSLLDMLFNVGIEQCKIILKKK